MMTIVHVLLQLPPASRHHGIAGPLDQDWERGSLDSGRGASEEENTSTEAVSVHSRSRSHQSRSPARSQNPGRCKSYPETSRAQNVDNDRGQINPNKHNRGVNNGQNVPSNERNIMYNNNTAPPIPRRLAPPTKVHAKPPAPEPPIQGSRSRVAESLDNTLDSQATTMSGEYVLSLPRPSDVYV